MSEQVTDKLVIQLQLQTKQLQEGLTKAEGQLKVFSSNILSVVGGALDLLAIKLSTGFAKDLINSFVNTGAKLEFLSQRTNENVATLDKWGVAVQKAGGNADDFFNTVAQFQNKLISAKFGGDPQTMGILSYLGINPQKSNGEIKKTTDLFLELSSKLRTMSHDKQLWVGNLLGIDNATLRILSQGREATQKLIKSQTSLWDDKRAQRAQREQEKFIELNRQVDLLKLNIGESLLPILYELTKWSINFVNHDLQPVIHSIKEFSQETGLNGKAIAKLGIILMGLSAGVKIVKLLGVAFYGLGGAIRFATGPLGLLIAGLTTAYEAYSKYQEAREESHKNPNTSLPKKIFYATNSELFDYAKHGLSNGFDYLKNISKEALNWAQGMTETGNKAQIGYKMRKNAFGHYEKVLDSNGNPIPEAYGKYQIKPSTASEVMGRNVSANELMNDEFNSKVHDKLLDKWTKQYGSREAALAYYNGGNYGLRQLRNTGTTDYLEHIKSFIQRAGGMTNNAYHGDNNTSNTNHIQIAKIDMHNVSDKQGFINSLDNTVSHHTSTALAFSNGRIS